MNTLYKIYNRTNGTYPKNSNRTNSYYIKLEHARKAICAYRRKSPQDNFVIHAYDIVYREVLDDNTL
jgi:hypothetical protein